MLVVLVKLSPRLQHHIVVKLIVEILGGNFFDFWHNHLKFSLLLFALG